MLGKSFFPLDRLVFIACNRLRIYRTPGSYLDSHPQVWQTDFVLIGCNVVCFSNRPCATKSFVWFYKWKSRILCFRQCRYNQSNEEHVDIDKRGVVFLLLLSKRPQGQTEALPSLRKVPNPCCLNFQRSLCFVPLQFFLKKQANSFAIQANIEATTVSVHVVYCY